MLIDIAAWMLQDVADWMLGDVTDKARSGWAAASTAIPGTGAAMDWATANMDTAARPAGPTWPYVDALRDSATSKRCHGQAMNDRCMVREPAQIDKQVAQQQKDADAASSCI